MRKKRLREYYFTSFNDLRSKSIIVLNIHFLSQKKLVLVKKDEPVTSISNEPELHTFRFETYSDLEDWVITDIDHQLGGNPYFSMNK